MNRTVICIVLALAAICSPSLRSAWADDPAPTKDQLEAAKKAYGEGKQLHDQGKLPEAIEKFKESYRLSRNPVLLYNIGLTLDENAQKDLALFYYRKFLSDAPQDAAQRKAAAERVSALEKDKLEADLNGTKPEPTKAEPAKPEPPKSEPTVAKPVKIKPAGTYGPADFQHQVVDEAPPAKPLDITAFVPEDSGFTVTLNYRGSGESKFTAKPMKWRYKELVARIPSSKVSGSSIQYFLEVKDQAGNLIARSGKSTSPNLVNLDAAATPRFYPDITDDGDKVASTVETRHHDDEDPLHPTAAHDEATAKPVEAPHTSDQPELASNGFRDVGSQKFKYAKWGSTASAGTLLALSMTFYILAAKQASNLEADLTFSPGGGTCALPPCHPFDGHDADIQAAGKRFQTISNLTLGVGVVTAAVAGYFWYRELTAKKHGELNVTTKASSPETTWVIAPLLGDGASHFMGGAAAAVQF